METGERFYKFSKYLKERFACRVYKVSINAGFSCPNRDGRLSRRGCIYCDNRAFSFNTRVTQESIKAQIEQGMAFGKKRYAAEKFIIYFQAYTNTYASLDTLRRTYDLVRKFKDIAGMAIGTRPDCVDSEILDLISDYARDYEVWLEYGLQSIHQKTLQFINRGHLYADFLKAVNLTRNKHNIKICAHLILGLPNETREDMLNTAKEIGTLKLDGIKIHPLHVIKGTKLEELLESGQYSLLGFDEYVCLVMDFLEYLWPGTVIQRMSADCPPEFLAGPQWIIDKNKLLQEIEHRLSVQDRHQGRLYINNTGLAG